MKNFNQNRNFVTMDEFWGVWNGKSFKSEATTAHVLHWGSSDTEWCFICQQMVLKSRQKLVRWKISILPSFGILFIFHDQNLKKRIVNNQQYFLNTFLLVNVSVFSKILDSLLRSCDYGGKTRNYINNQHYAIKLNLN